MTAVEPVSFREVQRFRMPWLLVVVSLLAASAWALFVVRILFGREVGTSPAPDGLVWLILALIGVVLPAIVIFGRMVTMVVDDALVIRWLPIGGTRIPYEQIREVEVAEYRPLRDYGGWGIRWTPWAGWAWNVHGRRGVRLVLEDGRRVMVGSQQPEALAAALDARR